MTKHKYGVTLLNGVTDYVTCEVMVLVNGVVVFGRGKGFVDGSKLEELIVAYPLVNLKEFFHVAQEES